MAKLTLRKRIELIEYHEKTGGTLLSTARKYNVTITTVHKTLKNKSEIVKRYNSARDGRAKRFSLSENAVVDFEVGKWYVEQRGGKRFGGVTKWELRRIVSSVAKEYNIDFKMTSGWLQDFVKKYGVVLRVVSRKSDVVSKIKAGPKKGGHFGTGIVNYILKRNYGKLGHQRHKTDDEVGTKNKVLAEVPSNPEDSVQSVLNCKDANKKTNIKEMGDVSNKKSSKSSCGITESTKFSLVKNGKLCRPASAEFGSKKDRYAMQVFSDLNRSKGLDNLKNGTKECRNKNPHKGRSNRAISKLKGVKHSVQVNLVKNSKCVRPRSTGLGSQKGDQHVLTNPSDVASGVITNLKASDNIKSPRQDQCSTQAVSRLGDTESGLENTSNTPDTINDSPKVDQVKKNKVGRPKSFRVSPRNGSNREISKLKGIKHSVQVNLNKNSKYVRHRRTGLGPQKVQGDQKVLTNPSNVASGVITNLKASDNIKRSLRKDQCSTQAVSILSDTGSGLENTSNLPDTINDSPKVEQVKKNKVGRPKSFRMSPRNGENTTQVLSNLGDSSDVASGVITNLKANDNIKRSPRQDQCSTQAVSKLSDSRSGVENTLNTPDTINNSPKVDQVKKNKVGRPKTFRVSPRNGENTRQVLSNLGESSDIASGVITNLKASDNIKRSLRKEQCSTQTVSILGDTGSGLENTSNPPDTINDSPKVDQVKKNKVGRPKSFRMSPRNDENTTQVLSNLGDSSDVASGVITNFNASDNIKRSLRKDQCSTQAVSILNDTGSGIENTSNSPDTINDSPKVDQVKRNKVGRPKSFRVSPRNGESTTQVLSNLGDSVMSIKNELKGTDGNDSAQLDTIRKKKANGSKSAGLRPRRDQGATERCLNLSGVVSGVDNKFKATGTIKDQVKKNKVGRPKSTGLSPRDDQRIPQDPFDLSDVVKREDNNLQLPDNINKDQIKKNKLGRSKSVGLRPKKDQCSAQVLLNLSDVVNDTNNGLKVSYNYEKRNSKHQFNKNKIGRPKGINKVTKKVAKNGHLLKVFKNKFKVKVTGLITKGNRKVQRDHSCKGKRKVRRRESNISLELDARKVLEKVSLEPRDKVRLNNNYKTSSIESSSINILELDEKKKDVFEFNIDIEDAIAPVKRQRKTIIDLKPKKVEKVLVSETDFTSKKSIGENGILDLINNEENELKPLVQREPVMSTEISHLKANCEEKSSKKRGRKPKNIALKQVNHSNLVLNVDTAEFTKNPCILSDNIERVPSPDTFNLKESADIKLGFEENVSLEFTPKKSRIKSDRLRRFAIHDSKRRSTRLNSQDDSSTDKSEKNIKSFWNLSKVRKSDNFHEKDVLTDIHNEFQEDSDKITAINGNNESTTDNSINFSYEYGNTENSVPGDDVDLDMTDYCVAVEDGDVVQITCIDRSKKLVEEMDVDVEAPKAIVGDIAKVSKIDIISDIKIISGSKNIPVFTHSFGTSSKSADRPSKEIIQMSPVNTIGTNEPSSPTGQSYHPLDETWSNLFPELDSDLSTDELVTKINEIDFQYDSDPFKDVKIQVFSVHENEEEPDQASDGDDGQSSQGQPMPPPNQMQQSPNNMQNGYRPPMPPTGRAPAPRGPPPGASRMPGGPRGPQMNQRAPGARPRAPMVRPRGAGAQPIRGQMRPRMTGPQNGIRPSNQTSPAKRTPEQNNAMQAKRKKLDVLTPSDKDDDDCQVICMQPKNTDGGLPQIESVQGAESVENSIMHLSDSITLSVRNPPPKPVASPVKSDAKAVANILATRGITVTASAKSKESHSPVKQGSALPTALSLNGAVSIVASKTAPAAKPAAPDNLPTVDLTDDSTSSREAPSPTKNRPGLPYRCDLCPAQYPNAMGLNKHRQTYHKTTSGMCELGVPLINIKQPGIMQKLSQMGINNYIPLPSAGPEGTYALPIISTKSPGNVAALGATQMLSLGPVRAIPRPAVTNNPNTPKK